MRTEMNVRVRRWVRPTAATLKWFVLSLRFVPLPSGVRFRIAVVCAEVLGRTVARHGIRFTPKEVDGCTPSS